MEMVSNPHFPDLCMSVVASKEADVLERMSSISGESEVEVKGNSSLAECIPAKHKLDWNLGV